MTRTIRTRRLLLQNFLAAIVLGAAGPLIALLRHDQVTRVPDAMLLSLLASAVALRIAPRARYSGTLLATVGTVAVCVGAYIAGERVARLSGGPPPWLPDRSWVATWGIVLVGFTLIVRYFTVVARARRIRARRSTALVA